MSILRAAGRVLLWVLGGVTVIVLFLAAVLVMGTLFEGVNQRTQERERCLRHATNGLEVERCR